MEKIDCNVTMNFVKEAKRMCESYSECIDGCPFYKEHTCMSQIFTDITEESIYAIQKWSDEHPPKTRKDVLLEKFPNARLNDMGVPDVCTRSLGFKNVDCSKVFCDKCWNMPADETD